jgi:hypothetical protein
MKNNYFRQSVSGSSFLSPAHGRCGARATINLNKLAQRKNFGAKPKQAGKKEGGLREGIFARLLCPPKADWGWEAARPCASKEAKPAKIVSLIEKPLKRKRNFCGLCLLRQWRSEPLGGIIQNPLADFAQRKFEPRPESTANITFQVKYVHTSWPPLIFYLRPPAAAYQIFS